MLTLSKPIREHITQKTDAKFKSALKEGVGHLSRLFDDIPEIPKEIKRFGKNFLSALKTIPKEIIEQPFEEIKALKAKAVMQNPNMQECVRAMFRLGALIKPYILNNNDELSASLQTLFNKETSLSNQLNSCYQKYGKMAVHRALFEGFIATCISHFKMPDAYAFSKIVNLLNNEISSYYVYYNNPENKAARLLSESLESCINYLEEDWENLQNKLKNEAINNIKKIKCEALYKALDAFLAIKDTIDNKLKNRQAFSTKEIEASILAFHTTINATLPKVLHHTNPFFERANQIIDSLIKRIKYLFSKENSSFEYSRFFTTSSAKTVLFETNTSASIKSIRRDMEAIEPLIRSKLLKKS